MKTNVVLLFVGVLAYGSTASLGNAEPPDAIAPESEVSHTWSSFA